MKHLKDKLSKASVTFYVSGFTELYVFIKHVKLSLLKFLNLMTVFKKSNYFG